MHPTDHMSIALVYPFGVSIISGARYHLVATYSVSRPTWSCAGSEILKNFTLVIIILIYLLSYLVIQKVPGNYVELSQTHLDIEKSHIFKSQFWLTRRLDGFKSRCNILAEWMNLSPRNI